MRLHVIAKQTDKQRRCHERARLVTSCPPWQSEQLSQCVEIRWIPENPPPGEHLMRFPATPSGEEFKGAFVEPRFQVWLGVSEQIVAEIRKLTRNWFISNEAELIGGGRSMGEVMVVVGPSLWFVTGTQIDGAFTMPHFDVNRRRLQFLVCLALPQPIRNPVQELHWARSALLHELEHVWQFVSLNDTLLEPHWAPFAEMCAVYAETIACPESPSYLDYGEDFLRCLPFGITGVCSSSWRPQPYWTFPFMEHLSQACPSFHREIWRQPGMRSQGIAQSQGTGNTALKKGPWIAIDALLMNHGATLKEQWVAFCKTLNDPAPGSAAAKIAARFTPRLPTLRVDLRFKTAHSASTWFWHTLPLSAHWVQIAYEKDLWAFSWKFHEANSGNITVVARRQGEEWFEVTSSPLVFNGRPSMWDILIVDTTILDMSQLMDVSHRLHSSYENLSICISPSF